MNHFSPRRGTLACEAVPLTRIAKEVGTPTYVYSTATLIRHLTVLQEAFKGTPHLHCYAVKANSSLAILKLFAQRGAGFDIVSGGELVRVLAARGRASKVVFSGVGKTEEEMAFALKEGILQFNVESAEELLALDKVARRLKRVAPFAMRVNPHVDARTHRYIATGLKSSKFGVPFEEAIALYRKSRTLKGLNARGLDCHIGSQVTDAKPVQQAIGRVAELFRSLRGEGFALTHLDVGGGLGITYTDEKPPSVAEYARAVLTPLRGLDATLVMEPGRVLVGNAGVLLTRVLYRKKTPARSFVIVDAGMNDLIRPALYEAHHEIVPVVPRRGKKQKVDVVGPVCESSDVLGYDRALPPQEQGDLLAVLSAGAYGMSMASNYNARPRPAEVLVDGKSYRVVRRRESLEDLLRNETP
ncbi:MAG: Diaminopimelate decarboxylase [Myxococcaceae bacterium]|nr:Diaminopimelate decarboxylase [Myxococcaceae bacterium]